MKGKMKRKEEGMEREMGEGRGKMKGVRADRKEVERRWRRKVSGEN